MTEPRVISIPQLALVVLVGASGSGKSSFARKHFKPTEVVSSDVCRGMVSDDENDQSVTPEAFELVHRIAEARLRLGRLTVIDATNARSEDRKPLVELARRVHALPIAIVLDVPARTCDARNHERPDRNFGAHVVAGQSRSIQRSLGGMKREGFSHVFVLDGVSEISTATIQRVPLHSDKRGERGPFDIVGDVHGCGDELQDLMTRLGYAVGADGVPRHPDGRKFVFLGDLCDRGPRNVAVLRLAMDMVEGGAAWWVPGNHDVKLHRHLTGRKVKISHGLEVTLREIHELSAADREPFVERYCRIVDGLASHLVFDDGRLVCAHAGMRQDMIGRGSPAVRDFALFGETTGETDEYGLPVRGNWAATYRGSATVVYGHTPTPEPEWLNRTINIDQGCVFGGRLTALRYPEKQLVSVRATRTWYEPARPLVPDAPRPAPIPLQWQHDEILEVEDFTGKHVIPTPLDRTITIRAEHAAAALEAVSRFAVDFRWLIYLPPTMSPSETSTRPGFLEHPDEVFAYFRRHAVPEVVCETKHMGSRAILIVCRDEAAGLARFGTSALGACYTRTGRPFFDAPRTRALLERLAIAFGRAGVWDDFRSDWLALDCEIMPWNLKAQELLRSQYAAVGTAATVALENAAQTLRAANGRGLALTETLARVERDVTCVERFRNAYRHYCWTVDSLDDVAVAPFHVLAAEGRTFFDRDHVWHMESARCLAEADPLIRPTEWRLVDLADDRAVSGAVEWWNELTSKGGEGFVVKPRTYVARDGSKLVQPALKCRGPEYLRIIYGPTYDTPESLDRLRVRGLGHKRSLALREFALGLEGVERFVRKDPLRRVHECAFGVLALESEPVDPRL